MAWSVAKAKLLDEIKHNTPEAVAKEIRRKANERALVDVYGEGFKRDRTGKPMEQGLGTPGNQTAQSVAAYEKWGVNEPDYDKNLARMKKELADCNERRAAERKADGTEEY
ncbi:MAG: hypothetical protein WAK55_03890 [Xanthobacteraceae bacterium]